MVQIDFVNVGYGDCILVRELGAHGSEFAVLVDCGDVRIPVPPGSGRRSAANYLQAQGVTRLDLVIVTHLHLDHVGGLEQLLDNVQVGCLWSNYLPPTGFWGKELTSEEKLSPGAENLLVAYNLYSRCLRRLWQGGTQIRLVNQALPPVTLGSGLKIAAFCQGPALYRRQDAVWQGALQSGATNEAFDDLDRWINDTSIRLRLSWRGNEIELPGDLGTEVWLATRPEPCHILKLPHHGHRGSLTTALLERLAPGRAVICVSDDRLDDCPSGQVLTMLREAEVPVSLTDLPGQSAVCLQLEPRPGAQNR